MNRETLLIDEIDVGVEFTKHARRRMLERGIDGIAVQAYILRLGERILQMKNGEEFAIVNSALTEGIICSVNCFELDLYVDVITVLGDDDGIYVSRGTQIFKMNF